MFISVVSIKKCSRLFFFFLISLTIWTLPAYAQGLEVSEGTVTDVTTRSFSVVWTSSEAGSPDLKVFNSSCVDITASVNIESMPVDVGDPSLSGAEREASKQAIIDAAQSNGVLKARVSSLDSSTAYHYQTVTTSLVTSSVVHDPDPNNCTGNNEVVTEDMTVRSKTVGSNIVPFSNDIMLKELSPALGTLIIAEVDGGNNPLSAFIGDGIPAPAALVDMNNIFGSSNQNIEMTGDEIVRIYHVQGHYNESGRGYGCPPNSMMASIMEPEMLTQTIQLLPGWNIISFQLEPEVNDVATVFGPVMSDVEIVWAYDSDSKTWLSFNPAAPPFFNDLTHVKTNVGYEIKMKAEADLPIDGAWDLDPVYLSSDWNLIGIPYLTPEALPDILASIAGMYDIIWGYDATPPGTWLSFNPNVPPIFNDLLKTDPTRGYLIKMNQRGEL